MISRFFTKEFTLSRQSWTDGKSAFASQGTFNGHIQQGTDDTLSQFQGLRFSKTFVVWCPSDTDIKDGDKLAYDGNVYDVRYVIDRVVGSNKHLEVIVEKVD